MSLVEATVQGEYVAIKGKKDREIISFTEKFLLLEERAALSVIQRKLIGPRLKAKNVNFLRSRTCELLTVGPSKAKAPVVSNEQILKMNMSALAELAVLRGVDFRMETVGGVIGLRKLLLNPVKNTVLRKKDKTLEEFGDMA